MSLKTVEGAGASRGSRPSGGYAALAGLGRGVRVVGRPRAGARGCRLCRPLAGAREFREHDTKLWWLGPDAAVAGSDSRLATDLGDGEPFGDLLG